MNKKLIIAIIAAIAIVAAIAVVAVVLGGGSSTHTHTYGEWKTIKATTCTVDGSEERICECGETQTQTVFATGHNYGEWCVVKEATCTEAGEKERFCECGEMQSQTISAIGHDEGAWIVEKESTCTEDGKKTKKCKKCQEILETIILPASHEYKNDICSLCGKGVFDIVIPSLPQAISTDFGTYYTQSKASIKSVTYKMEKCVWEDGTYNLTF